MRILVTGHKGFIGQNMVPALRAAGHEVSTFDHKDTPECQAISVPCLDNLDWVIHLGAISSTTETNVEKVMALNYDFSVELYEQCMMKGINFQYASSASIYGLKTYFGEDGAVDPRSPYAWSKYLFERYVEEMPFNRTAITNDDGKLMNVPVIAQGFRYFNVYGPHEEHKGDQASPQHKFEKQAKETKTIKLFEDSYSYFRDFVSVEYVIDIHQKFFNVKESGIWNVGTGDNKSFATVAREIANKHNATIKYIRMPDDVRLHYQTNTKADTRKLKATLHAAGLS